MAAHRFSSVRLDVAGSGRTGKGKIFSSALTGSEMCAQQPSSKRRCFDAIHDANDPEGI
jgi:hypothetical protein